MAITTTAAILGGAALVGGALNASATNKATRAAEVAAAENARIQQAQYAQTRSDLAPYNQAGVRSNDALSRYYGLTPPTTTGGTQGQAARPDYNAYLQANPDVAAYAQAHPQEVAQAGGAEAYAAQHYQAFGQQEGRQLPMTAGTEGTPGTPSGDPTFDTAQYPDRPTDYGSAPDFSSFFDPNPSQQYRDELGQVTRGVNSRAGMQGGYFSGNRAKELQSNADRLWRADEERRFNRANTLYQTALGQYNVTEARGDARFDTNRAFDVNRIDTRTNDLFRLTGVGLQAAGATANAGQNYAAGATANNNNLASITGNAALAGAANTNSLIGDAIGAYSMFGGQVPRNPYMNNANSLAPNDPIRRLY